MTLRAMRAGVPYLVAVLSAAYLLAIVDRMALSLLVEPIKADLALTDTQIGLLTGLAFGLFYTLLGIPLGRLADRVARPALAASGVLLWSVATLGCGLANTFGRLFAARVLVGIGEASISPAAYSLIADRVPPCALGRTLSAYMLGTVAGVAIAWIAGGQILQWLSALDGSHWPLISHLAGWQGVFLLLGVPGLLVAPLLLLIPESRKASPVASTDASWAALRHHLHAGRALYWAQFAGMAAVNTYGFGLVTWAPAMLQRGFGWSVQRSGLVLGTAIMLSGTLGMLLSGRLADHLLRRGIGDASMRVVFLGTLLLVPVAILGPMTTTPWGRVLLFVMPAMGLFFAVVACAPVVLQIATPAALRASVSSIYLFVVNIVAYALGPLSVGLISDRVVSGRHDLGTGLLALGAVSLPLGACAFRAGLGPMRRLTRRA